MAEKRPLVFIVDDDRDVRLALAFLLSTAHLDTRSFASAADFLASRDLDAPGCVLLDLVMPGLNGLEAQSQLAALGSTLPIVFLTGYGSIADSVAAMRAGAISFLTKPVDQHSLFRSIDEALRVDAQQRSTRQFARVVEERLATLTPREREVLAHVVAGRMNKQIAGDLGTGVKTIKVHRARVMCKMKVRSLAQLIRIIMESGVRLEASSGKPAAGVGEIGREDRLSGVRRMMEAAQRPDQNERPNVNATPRSLLSRSPGGSLL